MQKVTLFGYTIYENGDIIGLKGNLINKEQSQIKITLKHINKRVSISYARFVYWAFHQDTFDFKNKEILVTHKDNDQYNYNINNLVVINKRDILQGEKHKLSKLTNEQVEEIKEVYKKAQENSQNTNKNNPFVKVSFRKLAEKYNVSHSLVRDIIRGKIRNKNNYIIK